MLIFVLNLIAGRISRVQCSVRRRNSHHSLWNQGRGMVKPPAAPLVGWQLVLHGLASEEMHRQFAQHWDIPRYWTSCFRYFRSNLCIGMYSLTIQISSKVTTSFVTWLITSLFQVVLYLELYVGVLWTLKLIVNGWLVCLWLLNISNFCRQAVWSTSRC